MLMYPRRLSGSQSDRERKRRDESFQARAEEPLRTDSHQTNYTKWSSVCLLLIGHKNAFYCCAQSAYSFSWVLRVFVYLAILVRFLHQGCACKGNFHFIILLFQPVKNEESTDDSGRLFGCYQQSAGPFQFAPRKSCFWPITRYRKLYLRRRDRCRLEYVL